MVATSLEQTVIFFKCVFSLKVHIGFMTNGGFYELYLHECLIFRYYDKCIVKDTIPMDCMGWGDS